MCDTVCVRQPVRTLFAKSSDRPVDERQVVERHGRRPSGGTLRTTYLEIPDAGAHALVGSRPDWMWGLEHGVNEHGLAIGNEEIWTVDDPAAEPDALTGMDLVRLGLERAATADEALDVLTELLARHGQGGVGNRADDEAYYSSFLVADGRAGWVLETSGRSWVARPVAGGAAISNRVSLGTDWTRSSPDIAPGTDFDTWRHPTMWTGHADVRLAANRSAVVERAGDLGPPDLAAALRNHGAGPWGAPGSSEATVSPPPPGPGFDPGTGEGVSVCMHLRGFQATTASVVAELPTASDAPVRAWFGLANPCVSVLVPLRIHPSAGATGLDDPALPDRFAALARTVEGDDGAERLRAVRAVLGPLESALWQEAEALSDDPAAWDAFAGSVAGRLDAALGLLGC